MTTTANDGSHIDAIAAKGGGTFTYQVCEVGGSARGSNPVSVAF